MRYKKILMCVLIFVLPILSGCWDAYEIREQTLISLIGIDKNDDKVRYFAENITDEDQQGPESQTQTKRESNVLISEAATFTEARTAYDRRNRKDAFLGIVKGVVFSDEYVKSGIEEYINRLRGVQGFRKTIPLYTTTTKLEELFDSKKLNTQNIGDDISHKMDTLVKNHEVYRGDISEIMENILVKNTAFVLNNIDVIDNAIEMTGYSIVKDHKKLGFIPANQMAGVNYLILNKAYSQYTFPFDDNTVALDNKVIRKSIKAAYDGENVRFSINIKLNSKILNFSKKINLDDNKTSEIENKLTDIIKREISNTIDISQNRYGCDYLFFYKAFRAKFNSAFKRMNWNDVYKNAKFDITVTSKVTPGNLLTFE